MIFKKVFFSALVLICWVHVCYGVITDDKPATTSSNTMATPGLQFDRMPGVINNTRETANKLIKEYLSPKLVIPSMSSLLQLFSSIKGNSKVHGDHPFDYNAAGSDIDQGNTHTRRPKGGNSLSKEHTSKQRKVEILQAAGSKKFDLGQIKLTRGFGNRERRSGEKGEAGQVGSGSILSKIRKSFSREDSSPSPNLKRKPFVNEVRTFPRNAGSDDEHDRKIETYPDGSSSLPEGKKQYSGTKGNNRKKPQFRNQVLRDGNSSLSEDEQIQNSNNQGNNRLNPRFKNQVLSDTPSTGNTEGKPKYSLPADTERWKFEKQQNPTDSADSWSDRIDKKKQRGQNFSKEHTPIEATPAEVQEPIHKTKEMDLPKEELKSLCEEQYTKNYKDKNDPDFWGDFHDMNTEQKNELARNFYKRMILEKDGSAKDEDINDSFEKLSKVQFLKNFLQKYAEQEYIHINTEPSPENDKNTNDPQYDAMNYELRKELAKRRYTRYYKKMIDPFTGTFIQDCPRTRDEIETYFDYLWPEYISDLSKTEYNEFIKEQMYYKNHPSVKDDPVKLEKFNKMSISDLLKTARQRYYRRRDQNLAPISDIPVPYADTTEEGKNYDFIQMSPYVVISIVRAEFSLKT